MLSHNETKILIQLLLETDKARARSILYDVLQSIQSNEGKFYKSIIYYSKNLGLTSEQWFELLSVLPSRILRSDIEVEKILSEEQIKKLPPENA